MLWGCLAHPDVDVSLASSDAVGSLLQTLKRQLQAGKDGGVCCVGGKDGGAGGVLANGTSLVPEVGRFRAMDHLPQLLATLYQRMKWVAGLCVTG